MITIDIADDVREYYVLKNTVDDVTLENVTVLQNQMKFNILIKVDNKRFVINPGSNIVFDTTTSVVFDKGANNTNLTVGAM